MLSKMARVNEVQSKEYNKMKINELKTVLREKGLKITGNKHELIERIEKHQTQFDNAIKIQKVGRGYLARTWIKLKQGEKTQCVNESDFYTLEPINEIPFYYYIHYTEDASKTSYVFNIMSICTMIAKSGKFQNPYTRENMKKTYGNKLGRIIKLTIILFSGSPIVEEFKKVCFPDKMIQKEEQIIGNDYNRRVIELFIAIDMLGNYTDKIWFTDLTNLQICNLVLKLHLLWRSTTDEVKNNISPNVSPFSIQNTGAPRVSMDRTIEQNRIAALRIAEAMVYRGVTNEYKIMGAMFFLSGLTTVSYAARLQLPWLYDNFRFMARDM